MIIDIGRRSVRVQDGNNSIIIVPISKFAAMVVTTHRSPRQAWRRPRTSHFRTWAPHFLRLRVTSRTHDSPAIALGNPIVVMASNADVLELRRLEPLVDRAARMAVDGPLAPGRDGERQLHEALAPLVERPPRQRTRRRARDRPSSPRGIVW